MKFESASERTGSPETTIISALPKWESYQFLKTPGCQLPPAVCSTTDVCFVEFACFSANAYTFRFHQLLLALTFLHILSWKSLCHAIAGFILHRFVARARGWRHHPGLYDEMLNASFSLSSSSTGSLASSWKLNNISAESALCNFQLNFSEWGSV